jgi:hypothetical protein
VQVDDLALAVGVRSAESLLVELADAGLGYLVDEAARGRSSQRGSGTPITAASRTPGCSMPDVITILHTEGSGFKLRTVQI